MFSSRQFTFVWRRGRSFYGWTLFVGVRYAALAHAVLGWIPVRQNSLSQDRLRVHKPRLMLQDRGWLSMTVLWRGWQSSLSHVQDVSLSYSISLLTFFSIGL